MEEEVLTPDIDTPDIDSEPAEDLPGSWAEMLERGFDGDDEDASIEATDAPESEETSQEGESAPKEENAAEAPQRAEIDYPDFVGNDLRVPETFEDEKKELDWYRENYGKAFTAFQSPEFSEKLAREFESTLLEREQEVEKVRAIKQAMDGNPTAMLKIYFPEALSRNGQSAIMSADEMEVALDDALRREWGDNYADVLNDGNHLNPNTLSGKIYASALEIRRDIEARNEENSRLMEQSQPVTEESVNARLEEEFTKHFEPEGFTREEFTDFLKEAAEFQKTVNLSHMHKLMHFEDYLENAREEARREGFEEGKKSVLGNIERAGRPVKPETTAQKPQKEARKRLPQSVADLYNYNFRR